MSKIICDICGTSYPETAKQCPICGCVRPGDVQRVTNEIKNDGKVSTGYTYVKGGRFSKTNVKKRSQGGASVQATSKTTSPKKENDSDEKTNRGLVITAAVLLLAIIGVVIYIAIRFFAPISVPDNTGSSTTDTQQNVIDLTCKEITLDVETVLFGEVGEARLLYVTVSPENTTDKITFRSEDENIVTVSDAGKITAVAEGTTKIIITCGDVTKECTVTCQFNEPSSSETIPDETTEPVETTQPAETIRLNRKDITFDSKGSSWVLYSGSVAKNLITWSSDDETVAVFTDGKVVAVGPGMTNVHAEFEGQKVSCIIRCSFKDSTGVGGNGGVSEDGGGSSGNGGVSEDGGSSSNVITGYANCEVSVNIRSGPGTSYEDVGDLYANEKVTITETRQGADGMTWGKIGENKWVSMTYIKTN